MTKSLPFVAVLAIFFATSSRAASNDCLFDGTCAARPSLAGEAQEPVDASAHSGSAASALGRLGGDKKESGDGILVPRPGLVGEAPERAMHARSRWGLRGILARTAARYASAFSAGSWVGDLAARVTTAVKKSLGLQPIEPASPTSRLPGPDVW